MTLEITLTESELKKAETLAREWAESKGYTGDSFERVVRNFIKGYQEGIAIGEEEAKIAIAKNMLQENVDIAIIMESTGLTEDAINALKK